MKENVKAILLNIKIASTSNDKWGYSYTKTSLEDVIHLLKMQEPNVFGEIKEKYEYWDSIRTTNINLQKVGFKISNYKLKNDELFCDIEILNTESGNDILNNLKNGHFGLSCMGDVQRNIISEKNEVTSVTAAKPVFYLD